MRRRTNPYDAYRRQYPHIVPVSFTEEGTWKLAFDPLHLAAERISGGRFQAVASRTVTPTTEFWFETPAIGDAFVAWIETSGVMGEGAQHVYEAIVYIPAELDNPTCLAELRDTASRLCGPYIEAWPADRHAFVFRTISDRRHFSEAIEVVQQRYAKGVT